MRLIHLNIVCSDFERSYEFYTKIIGMTPVPFEGPEELRGHLPGEFKPPKEYEEEGHKLTVLDFEGSCVYRGAFLRWGDDDNGPMLDLLQWRDGGKKVRRTGLGSTV